MKRVTLLFSLVNTLFSPVLLAGGTTFDQIVALGPNEEVSNVQISGDSGCLTAVPPNTSIGSVEYTVAWIPCSNSGAQRWSIQNVKNTPLRWGVVGYTSAETVAFGNNNPLIIFQKESYGGGRYQNYKVLTAISSQLRLYSRIDQSSFDNNYKVSSNSRFRADSFETASKQNVKLLLQKGADTRPSFCLSSRSASLFSLPYNFDNLPPREKSNVLSRARCTGFNFSR